MSASFCVEAQALESVCCVAALLKILVFPRGGAQTKREGSPHMSSPIIKHFFVSLCVVVHAAEHAPISSQGSNM